VQHGNRRPGTAISAPAITAAVVRAIPCAGVDSPLGGAYVFRHTVAGRMLKRGAPLKEVADFLGHQSLDTTTIYAKLDLPALQDVALPWPEVSP